MEVILTLIWIDLAWVHENEYGSWLVDYILMKRNNYELGFAFYSILCHLSYLLWFIFKLYIFLESLIRFNFFNNDCVNILARGNDSPDYVVIHTYIITRTSQIFT